MPSLLMMVAMQVSDRDEGNKSMSTMTMIDKHGSTRTRDMRNYAMDLHDSIKKMAFFLSPPSVKIRHS
ncbi:MAG: hypothetical protein KUG83_06745 [Gammaproteobacteria bacterium]|nr:hypothetical protein [Gammaproteobacteria bacterium]